MIKIYLKKGKDEALARFHPWIFSGAIARTEGQPEEGDIVHVYSHSGSFLAVGMCQIGSIAVRILSFENVEINDDFWFQRLSEAYALREKLGLTDNPQTNCYRLVHGEGDRLPGLIIDIYNDAAVVQAHAVGMYLCRNSIAEALKKIYGNRLKAIYDKSSQTLPFKAGLNAKDEYLFGSNPSTIVLEHGKKFKIDWEGGQKTGFFLDQRENRKLLEEFCKDKKVLNTFAYTGGFSIYALNGGAKLVHSVDSSAKAMQLTDENVQLNFGDKAPHQSFAQDTFDFFKETQEKYDVIILDPPAFAKHGNALKNALQGYKRLNAQAFSQINKDGFLFTYSCSQAVSREQFRLAVFSAAAISKRNVRIVHQLSQPADHPINIYHPEGEYLKGLVLYVE